MTVNAVTTIRGKPLKFYPASPSKSDWARELLKLGYTASEIANAVPMAYSQVHSIKKKLDAERFVDDVMGKVKQGKAVVMQMDTTKVLPHKAPSPIGVSTVRNVRGEAKKAEAEKKSAQKVLDRERASEAAGKRPGPRAAPRVGKLRTGNLPNDIDVGPCANCGFDLVVRRGPYGLMFTHVNATSEEYLAKIQFCQAVPEKLVK